MKQLENHSMEFSSEYYKIYSPYLSKPQFENFKIMTKGILHGIAHAEESARLFSDKDPSTVRKFMSSSPWEENKINRVRISHANQILQQEFMKYVPIAIDDNVNKKYGKLIPGSGYHFSNSEGTTIWGQTVVSTHFTIGENDIPLWSDIYFKEDQCKEDKNKEFRSKIDIAVNQIDKISNHLKLDTKQTGVVTTDSWYSAGKLINQILASQFEGVLALKKNRKVFYRDQEIRVDQLAKEQVDEFEEIGVDGTTYRVWTAKVGMKNINQDQMRLVISQQKKEESDEWSKFGYLIGTDTNMGPWTMLYLYQRRWNIETFYKFGKEKLGFDKSRVENERTLLRFFILLFCVYTLISLSRYELYVYSISSKSKYEVQEKLLEGIKKEVIIWVYIQAKKETELEQILLQLGMRRKIA